MKSKSRFFKRFFTEVQLVVFTLLFTSSILAAGGLDLGFTSSLSTPATGRIEATAIQPDGKILAYGSFKTVSGTPINANPSGPTLVRINPDGTLDTSFNAPFIAPSSQVIPDIALQSTGKIIVAGGFATVGGQTIWGIVRLNQDGSLDPTFTVNNFVSWVYDVDVLPDDRIIVPYGQGLRRLLPDGAIDPTFAGNSTFYSEVGYQADGKILAATADFNILTRFNSDGTVDSSFAGVSFDSRVWDIKVQTDGKILVGGQFTTLNGFPRRAIARLNADGTGDTTFTSPFSAGFVFKMIPQPDGKTYVCGTNLTPTNFNNVFRLNADGTRDTGFVQAAQIVYVWDLEQQPDGKLIVSGSNLGFQSQIPVMFRVNSNGSGDATFKINFGFNGLGRKIFVQPDGKILVGGKFNFANNEPRTFVARFNADGTVDTGFNAGFTYSELIFSSIDMQPDGKIIVGAETTSVGARRLNSNGSLDITFSSSNNAFDVKVLSSGKILVAGNNSNVRRYNSDGTPDTSFNVVVSGSVNKIAVQPDGKILIGGTFTTVNSVNRGNIARLNADGTLDMTFDSSTGAASTVYEIIPLSSGQILIGGSFTGYNFVNRPYIARLNSNASLDTSFTPTPNEHIRTIKVQPNNKILIGGAFTTVNSISKGRIARLNQDGNLDVSFNPGSGANATIFDIEYQSDEKILIAGDFTSYNGVLKSGFARLENSSVSETLFDYDGDAKADVSVYRPSTNRWYIFKSSDSSVSETTFGIAGDVPVPADFDGDGKTDIAIFRASSGDWWSSSSINGAQIFAHWGANGDIPRPSDFDGDGRTDYVVFRPSDNFWYRISSANGATSNQAFGLAGDKPVTGDFDGDGKSDKAIYRPSAGTWWYQSSINNAQLAVQWGISTDIPAPADFDSDGKTDFAVYRPSTGVWYIINSSNGSFLIMAFGIAEDKPVPADYDGDGKSDIAVFRPSTGTWYQMKTTAGFAAQQFGVSTDIPTENAFVP